MGKIHVDIRLATDTKEQTAVCSLCRREIGSAFFVNMTPPQADVRFVHKDCWEKYAEEMDLDRSVYE